MNVKTKIIKHNMDNLEGKYINYPSDTMVEIKGTGRTGEAFESAMGFISVLVDDECLVYELDEVIFL